MAIRLKNMFPRIPKTQTKVFDLPATLEMAADLLWMQQRFPFVMSAQDRQALEATKLLFDDDRAASEAIMLPDWQPPARHGFRPGKEAYHYQKQASEMWHRRKGLLLGDDVGLGKTIAALDGLAGSQYLPAAIVVQAHLPSQWVNEFIKPFTYMNAHVIQGTKPYSLPPANLYIFRYSNIAGWTDIFATGMFKAVVFDEIQELRRGTEAEKGKAALVLAQNAALRLGLSASPVYNLGSEMWNILSVIDPEVLGPWEDFVREWCVMASGGKWRVEDPDALGSYLRESGVFLRRLRQGRPINRIPIEVDFDEEIADNAAELAKKLAIKVMNGSFVEAGLAARELDAFARLQTGLAKAKSVAILAQMYLEKGIPIILAGWHRDVYSQWIEQLKKFNPMLYTGSESARQKDRTKNAFINGDTNLMIISLRSGAGLDGLQKRCSTLIVGEMDWSNAVVDPQLIGRIDRPGQKADEITVVFPYVNYGSDPVLMSVNAIKKDQQRGINDPGAVLGPVYTDESRIKLLAQQFLQKRSA
ncbi:MULTISPECIES: DEAD/DEAH box helicase [unclassified Mesorhizobium]|uniref:SNF2-related protein n=1 Tax=unclassified Mesorhizobium TaxID=325217 RepID=UPI0013E40687|nr:MULTISPECIES: DEAD/DEAH box helicase [unclassified Mesorhizobium]